MNTSLIIRRITAIPTANVHGASLGHSEGHLERFEEGIKDYNCGTRGWNEPILTVGDFVAVRASKNHKAQLLSIRSAQQVQYQSTKNNKFHQSSIGF
jgi:hypothetical protein